MATEIRVPTLGESVSEATVGTWFKKVGDTVKADEPLVELETDKVTVEVPAPASGVLTEIVVQNGETVGLDALLGQIAEGARRRCNFCTRGKACCACCCTGTCRSRGRRSCWQRHATGTGRRRSCLLKTTFPPIRSMVRAGGARF